jgi:hypothetical protein
VKPDGDQLLRVLGSGLMADLAPRLTDDYLQRNAMMTGMLLAAAAEEWDRAAARRAEENAALRALFADAAPGIEDTGLRQRLEEAAGSGAGALLVAELERENAELRAIVIELHVHVEGLGTEEGRRIEEAIWRELRRSTERRGLSIAPF